MKIEIKKDECDVEIAINIRKFQDHSISELIPDNRRQMETLRQVNSTKYYRYKILWFLNTYQEI